VREVAAWLVLVVATGALACRADGTFDQPGGGRAKKDGGPAPNGEYGDDPGEADAKQDHVFMPPDDPDLPDGAVEGDEDGGTGADDGGGPAALTLQEAPARVAQLGCRRRLDCCPQAERSGLPDDPAACEAELAEQLAPFFEAFSRAVSAGRASYDAAALATCLSSFETAGCPEARAWEPLLVGSRCGFAGAATAAGEDCRSSYECTDGFCQGANQTRDGRCVSPRLADGQPCERGEDCSSGACHPTLDVCAPAEPGNLCD